MDNRKTKKNRFFKAFLIATTIPFFGGIGLAFGLYYYLTIDLPNLSTLQGYNPNIVTKVYSQDGQVIGEFYIERRTVVPISRMPKHLIYAFLAAEDARFFQHEGVDYWSILRAIYKNIAAGRIVQGGSTITQQVAKSFFLTPERSISRKIREVVLAHRIENNLSKEDILHLYHNQIYLGNGAYGVQSATETYFGKDVEELNLAEAALLAGLPKAPSRYSPYHHPDVAKARQTYVIERMLEERLITRKEGELALRHPLKFRPKEIRSLWVGPYFTEHIRRYIEERYGGDLLYRGGLQVYTTLNVELQKAANEAVKLGLREHDRRRGYRGPIKQLSKREEIDSFLEKGREDLSKRPLQKGRVYQGLVTGVNIRGRYIEVAIDSKTKGRITFEDIEWARLFNPTDNPDGGTRKEINQVIKKGDVIEVGIKEPPDGGNILPLTLEQDPLAQAALVAIDPATGLVKAMVGGGDFSKSQFNRVVQSRRQPGSAFKPIIYTAALDKGYTPASVIVDSPLVFEEALKGEDWRPRNFDEKFYGPTTFRFALTHSRNVVTIKILKDIGIDHVLEYARWFGIQSPLTRDLSLALGSSGVSLLELTSAFSVFANYGVRSEPIFTTKITDRSGNILEEDMPLNESLNESIRGRPTSQEVISPQTAYIMTTLLQGVIQEGTGRRAKALGRPAA
ncbi:MAG: PBP1A family penicillin-binding protein, partial [Deltaproteobacteria bacterium]|nr:PBP1A family penicillin-binding protein [Deltaproteobacteria bacterium]